MNPEQILANLKKLTQPFSTRQLVTMGVAFTAVVGIVVGGAYWANAPQYTLLYSGLDAESANSVVSRLKAAKIQYVLDDGGTAVRVPADRVDELRLDMASQGLPTAGRIGFEVFDRTAFGTTEFLEQVNFRRALEGELARTIATISEVASARVHIALAKDSLFSGEAQPAKASVVLKLKNNKPLAASTAAGIAGLVAASVESLRPESVVILDTYGRPLSAAQGRDDELGGAPMERQQKLEHELTAKIVELLEPVVGAGRVRANVTARLSLNSEEETEERWDPTTVVRSRQSSSDTSSAPGGVAGVAGTRGNLPPGASSKPASPTVALGPATGAGRTTETVNYEVNRLTRHTIAPRGRIDRLSVAVIIDDERVPASADGQTPASAKPRSPQDLERIRGLVAAAVGVDDARGDQLTVENIAFGDAPVDELPPDGWWTQMVRQELPRLAPSPSQVLRLGGVLLLALMAFVAVLRPMLRAALQPALAEGRLPMALTGNAAAGALDGAPTVADLEQQIEAELDAAYAPKSDGARRLPALTRRLVRKTEAEPEYIARLVRSLLIEEEN